MDSFQVKQLTNATDSQIQEITDFVTDAFYGDVAMKAFLGGDWTLLREMELSILRASLLEGVVLIVTIGEGENEKIVSSGYWFGNGAVLFGSEEQHALGFDACFAKLSEETKTWWTTTYAEEMTKLDQSHFTKEEMEKRWWCFKMATHPAYQGKGYATAMVNTMFEKATEERTFLGLTAATKENIEKYRAMGFHTRGEGGVSSSPTGDFLAQFMTKGSLP